MRKSQVYLPLAAVILALNMVPGWAAKKDIVDSPLDEQTQSSLRRACKSGNAQKALPVVMQALQGANDIPKCLAIAAYTESAGASMLDARRQCMVKALSLCQSRQDFIQVALKSRQYQCYEVTRDAVHSLIGSATSIDDLYDLARKTQEVALNDVAHLSMEKAFTLVKTVPECLAFAREAKLLSMDDLNRKACKDLIDDEPNAHELMVILHYIEPFKLKDLDRYCMKKALDRAVSEQDFLDIYNASQRRGEGDIFQVALYRGRKARLMQQIKNEQETAQQALDAQQAKAQQDLQTQGTANPSQQNAGF
ncbi:MAG: hypothetical protein JST44_02205 [Cyanobacteria bacterium SZAS LIN-5]|jgi:hypothetical protein|nr:hypothetical protein [Cyanobacteria bacterium SZAS LIN-5]RTL46218.1 MAG: hypothetical protein EKK48_02455 [Candidatus Melainabacteria bacterium]